MSQADRHFQAGFGFCSAPTSSTKSKVRTVVKYGLNTDIGTGANEDIISMGGTYTFLSSADTLDLVSTSTADDLGSTGAQIVLLEGLDANWNYITELVNMDGTTPVTTTNSFLRINHARVVFSGSGKINAGDISIKDTSTGLITVSQILTGVGTDEVLIYSVPKGHELFLTRTAFSIQRASSSRLAEIESKAFVLATNTEVIGNRIVVNSDAGPTNGDFDWLSMPRLPEQTDFWYRVSYMSATSTRVHGGFRGLLVNSAYIPEFKI